MTPYGLLSAISTSLLGEGVRDEVPRHRRLWDQCRAAARATAAVALRRLRRFEPRTNVSVEPDAEHVVVERFAQAGAQEIVVGADGIVECDVVVRERDSRRGIQRDAVSLGVEADRRVGRRAE